MKKQYIQHENIGAAIKYKNDIFYTLSYNNNDRIMLVDTKEKRRYIFAESDYGNYYPSLSADKKSILFNQFDKYGFNIMTKKISKTSLEEVPYNENTKRALSLSTENKLYPTTSFQAWKHYFNPINYFAYPTLDQDLTITIESKDIMSHLFLSNSYTLL